MKFQDVARFEFRVFGSDLAWVRAAFSARAPGAPQSLSRETYVVTRLNVESNVKIRGGRLEVKGLEGRLRLLEQWRPILKSEFPVPSEAVENIVAPALGIDVELGAAAALTEQAFLALMAQQPALGVIRVDKERTLFDLGDCEGEVTELAVEDERLETAAIEAVEAPAAEALMREIGLEVLQNESYSIFLQRRLFAMVR
jgi:hypothetical protein